jgi:hypothetical protein
MRCSVSYLEIADLSFCKAEDHAIQVQGGRERCDFVRLSFNSQLRYLILNRSMIFALNVARNR